eukprot:1999407-Alexandrium_andersonii.AAC.1
MCVSTHKHTHGRTSARTHAHARFSRESGEPRRPPEFRVYPTGIRTAPPARGRRGRRCAAHPAGAAI